VDFEDEDEDEDEEEGANLIFRLVLMPGNGAVSGNIPVAGLTSRSFCA